MEYPIPPRKYAGEQLVDGMRVFKEAIRLYDKEKDSKSGTHLKFEELHIIGAVNIDLPELHTLTFSFNGCVFEDPVTFQVEDCRSLFEFHSCYFKQGICFLDGNYKAPVIMEHIIATSVLFSGGVYNEVNMTVYEADVHFAKGHFEVLRIGDHRAENCSINALSFHLGEVSGNIYVLNTVIKEASLQGTLADEMALRFKICRIKQLRLSHLVKKGELVFETIYWRYHAADDELLTGDEKDPPYLPEYLDEQAKKLAVKYHNSPLIEIDNCNMADTQLNDIDFNSFDEVNIYRSRVSDILFSNIRWPDKIMSLFPFNSRHFTERFYEKYKLSPHEYGAMRENYRQLKFACSKQQDYIGEQHFHGLEMYAYDKSIHWKDKGGTKAILKLSYYTSNFGQSILRPLACIAVINGILFYLIYLTGQGPFHSYDVLVAKNYVSTIAEFLRFTNPLHKNEPELTGAAFIIDLLMRMCASYFIYNLIRATRRFVR